MLGSKAFVAEQLAHYRRKTGMRKHMTAQALPPITDWGDMATMRGVRKNALG